MIKKKTLIETNRNIHKNHKINIIQQTIQINLLPFFYMNDSIEKQNRAFQPSNGINLSATYHYKS